MSESQLNKYDEEVKRLEDELNLVQKAIPTLAAAEKCVLRPLPRPSPPASPPRPRSLSLTHPPTAPPAASRLLLPPQVGDRGRGHGRALFCVAEGCERLDQRTAGQPGLLHRHVRRTAGLLMAAAAAAAAAALRTGMRASTGGRGRRVGRGDGRGGRSRQEALND